MEPDRRFSEREVALVLRKATEMEGQEGPSGSGLTFRELEQIAGEVGIAPELIRRAVADLDRTSRRSPLGGVPPVHESIRAVAGELGPEGVAALVAAAERRIELVGEVTEALGTTRWTARDRFRTTQVAISSARGETTVRVVERASARLKRVLHAMPTLTGAALATAVFSSADIGALGGAGPVGLAVVGAAAGAVVGRLLWGRAAAARAARVERLAAELAREAEGSSRPRGGGEEPAR